MTSSSMKGPIAKFKAKIKSSSSSSNATKAGSSKNNNKVDFKFPLSLVKNVIDETSESSEFCTSFEEEDVNLSVDLTSEEED